MNIELHEISIRDLVDGYADRGDEGVIGYGGRLDIRPAYQREFIYKDKQRRSVDFGRQASLQPQHNKFAETPLDPKSLEARVEAYERQHGVCPLCGAPFRVVRDGGRPHHAVARRRTYRSLQLPDALPRLQPPQGCEIVRQPGVTAPRKAG